MIVLIEEPSAIDCSDEKESVNVGYCFLGEGGVEVCGRGKSG